MSVQGKAGPVVMKFGGGPMSSPELIRASAAMVGEYSDCAAVVVSAPGRAAGRPKVTDLLIACWEASQQGRDFSAPLAEIEQRFTQITSRLAVTSVQPLITQMGEYLSSGRCYYPWLLSRGEVLMASVMAELLGWRVLPAEQIMAISHQGTVMSSSYNQIARAANEGGPFVLPGFMGRGTDGRVAIFSRGGSDISGAVLAKALKARLYVNVKDVPGVATANPALVSSAGYMPEMSYAMMHELSVRGAEVFHPDAVAPVEDTQIPTLIRSILEPERSGTLIASELSSSSRPVAVAGRVNCTCFEVHERGMNQQLGAGMTILGVFKEMGISFDHVATGQHYLSVVVAEEQLQRREEAVRARIDSLLFSQTATYSIALLSIVASEYSVRLLGPALVALEQESIAPLLVDSTKKGSAIIGIDPGVYEQAIRIVHRVVVK